MGFFHQSAAALGKQFQLTHEQARQIVQACANCQQVAPLPALRVNPRGLQALEIWQTDVTHIPEFGKLKHVHVMIDTFLTCIFASAHTGEHAKDVQYYNNNSCDVLMSETWHMTNSRWSSANSTIYYPRLSFIAHSKLLD